MFFLVVIDVMFCVEMCLQSIGSQSIFDNKSLLTLEDEEWRRIRVTITPTFSALKLKQVCVILRIFYLVSSFLSSWKNNEEYPSNNTDVKIISESRILFIGTWAPGCILCWTWTLTFVFLFTDYPFGSPVSKDTGQKTWTNC